MNPYYDKNSVTIYHGDALKLLKELPSDSIHCCITSPPYYGLRDYGTGTWDGGDVNCNHKRDNKVSDACSTGHSNKDLTVGDAIYKTVCPKCGAIRIDQQLGLEETPDDYVDNLVLVFREVNRVLKNDGTFWLNIGDSYAGSGKGANPDGTPHPSTLLSKQGTNKGTVTGINLPQKANKIGLKPKDLIGIPWKLAFALQADGWYLRQDIIWCLSGGATVYARTQKGDMPMTIKDLYRLNPKTVKLWNGQKWTQLLGMNKSKRTGQELEIVLRSGERISCTPTHKFPCNRGLLAVSDMKVGDILQSCKLPEPEVVKDCILDEDAAWFAGLYLAEGSKAGDVIQLAGHAKENERWERVQKIAKKFGGTATRTVLGNTMDIRVYGKVLNSILDELVSGRIAKDKSFATVVWRYSDKFISSMLDGYLSGDGSWDLLNNRWRLGFCRNYNLERDIRVACARLGYFLTLKMSTAKCNNKTFKTFRGDLKKSKSGHLNEKNQNEIMEIRKARCRFVYDLGVEDEPHLFSLSSGVLTHNSKRNSMPESVLDRCTRSHEYIFLLSKSPEYYFDHEIIKDPNEELEDRNKKSVWTVNVKPYREAHFATFPKELIIPCVLAGCPKGGVILDPFAGSGTTAEVAVENERKAINLDLNEEYIGLQINRLQKDSVLYKQELLF